MRNPNTLTPWARPFDVHGVEFPRRPHPVSGRRIHPGLTVFLFGTVAGAAFAILCVTLVIHIL